MGKKRIKKSDYKVTHDTFFDETFGMPSFGVAFLKAKLPRKIRKQLDLDKLTVERRRFRDELFRETRPDIVYHVPIRGTDDYINFYVITEHKSFDDHSAIFQLWGYVRQLCVQDVKERLTDPETEERKGWPKNFKLSPVIPIIIHHGPAPFSGKTQLADLFYEIPGVKEYLPHLKAILVDLSTIDEGDLPRDPNAPELFVVLLIMKVVFNKDPETIIDKYEEILDELKPYSQIPKYRELIRKLLYYVMYNVEMNEAGITRMENKTRETTGDNTMPSVAQMFTDKGKAEGKVELIIETLEARFDEVPQVIKNAITKISEPINLRQLNILAGNCKSLAEFKKALK